MFPISRRGGLFCHCCLIFLFLLVFSAVSRPVSARSAFSPRHTGMEPPGGPKQLEAMPGNSPSRTAEGGMGYRDAYGNTLDDIRPEEKKTHKRPRPGAYGAYGRKEENRPLPDPQADNGPPLWSFQ